MFNIMRYIIFKERKEYYYIEASHFGISKVIKTLKTYRHTRRESRIILCCVSYILGAFINILKRICTKEKDEEV